MRQSALQRAVVLAAAAVFLGPVVWLFTTAYRQSADIFGVPPRLLFSPTLANFTGLFQLFDVPELVLSTLVISLGTAALSLLVGVPCGYALSRLDRPWARGVAYGFLAVRMVPPVAVLIPFYLMMRDVGLLGSWWAVILVDAAQSTCFVVWMMVNAFDAVPREVEEAAEVDGCGPFRCFWKVALPLAKGGLVASAMFCVLFAWNAFLFAAFLTSSNTRPLSVAMISAFGSLDITWGTMGALAHFSVLPMVAMCLALNRHFVAGLTRGLH